MVGLNGKLKTASKRGLKPGVVKGKNTNFKEYKKQYNTLWKYF